MSFCGRVVVLKEYDLSGYLIQPYPRLLARAMPQLVCIAGVHERIRHYAKVLSEYLGVVILNPYIVSTQIIFS